MKRDEARQGLADDFAERSRSPYRTRPTLVVLIPLEGLAKVHIEAATHGDELRLRDWLRHALVHRQSLSADLMRMLDWLDVREAA